MRARLLEMWRRRPAVVTGSFLLLAVAGVWGMSRFMERAPAIPVAEVRAGEFVDSLPVRGEVKALRSLAITAPPNAGDLLIVKIATDGTAVKKGDPVVSFDKTKTEQDMAQYKSTMRSAQAEIDQARAQARLTEEEDVTAVMKAKYDVEAATLEAGKQEIVSAIDGEKARLKVSDAQQKLREAEQKQKSDRIAAKSTIENKIQNSKKAMYDMQRAERALGAMTLDAPVDGMVSLLSVWHGDGMAVFKAGDRAWPGAPIAEIPDISTLRITAHADETERGRLRAGQLVNVQMDAIPDRPFTGHIDLISAIASSDFTAGWPFPKNFTLQVLLDQTDGRVKPGMSAQLNIVVDKIPNAMTIPAQALFQKSGRSVVYVLHRGKFEEEEVEVKRRSGDQILVGKGLRAGDRVALRDPSAKE
ncbi:MAG TPA: efflux RND transporter periplasmic adaptor subunit [Terriglobales bacterium]|nr:efflux RND transporter periplasmic adaptor subunit [Terriglobales bacterium]